MKRRMKIPTLVNMEWQYEHKATLIAILIEQLDTRLRSRAGHAFCSTGGSYKRQSDN
jgi:hypothetical protein